MATETHIHIYPTNPGVGEDELIEWAEAIAYLLKGAAISAIVQVEANPTIESAYDSGLTEGRKAALIEAAEILEKEVAYWADSIGNLDPKPWWVDEAESRYRHSDVMESANEGEYGGTLYNLAKWDPRPGYSQKKEDYK